MVFRPADWIDGPNQVEAQSQVVCMGVVLIRACLIGRGVWDKYIQSKLSHDHERRMCI